MTTTLVLHLDDTDYDSLKRAADREGKALDIWLLEAAYQALGEAPVKERHSEALDTNGWPVGFFEATYGSLADDPLDRLPQGELETREAFR